MWSLPQGSALVEVFLGVDRQYVAEGPRAVLRRRQQIVVVRLEHLELLNALGELLTKMVDLRVFVGQKVVDYLR